MLQYILPNIIFINNIEKIKMKEIKDRFFINDKIEGINCNFAIKKRFITSRKINR